MKMTLKLLYPICLISLMIISFVANANTTHKNKSKNKSNDYTVNGPVAERATHDKKMISDYFDISLYKPNYLLPYYYTGTVDNAAYQNMTPGSERLKHNEVKFQFSAKVPAWRNVYNDRSTIYLAYTQLSYWQLYNQKKFMRENDYEPELFLANEVNWHLGKKWNINFLNVGAEHQSNGLGTGTVLERSWNRLYLEGIASNDNWMIDIKPWIVMSTNKNNNDIAKYLGYVQAIVAYKYHQQVFAIRGYNLVEHGPRRAAVELTWSFPIVPYIKGYIQVFSGYGQSLIEYNNRTNSGGIGITLSDWV